MTVKSADEKAGRVGAIASVERGTRIALIGIPLMAGLWLAIWTWDHEFRAVITPDSVLYIECAHWFAAGQGLMRGDAGHLAQVTIKPPLYAMALGAGTMLGARAADAALTINLWSFGVTLLFIGLIVWRLSGSVVAGIAAQGIAAVAWEFVRIHLFALSEPLCLALMTGGIWALIEYRQRHQVIWLLLSGELLSLAALCRYVGIGVVLGAVVFLALTSRRRLRDALVMGVMAWGPVAVWAVMHTGHGYLGVGRVIGFYGTSVDNLRWGMSTLGYFIAPNSGLVASVLWGVVTLGGLAAGAMFRRTRLIGFIALGYLLFIEMTILFGESAIWLDVRLLMPLGVMLLIIAMVMLTEVVRAMPGWRLKASVLCVAVFCLFNYSTMRVAQSAQGLSEHWRWGHGYQNLDIQHSPLMARLAELAPDVVPVSGEPMILRFLSGRRGVRVPIDPSGASDAQVTAIRALLEKNRVLFVDMLALDYKSVGACRREMNRWFDLEPFANEKDGTLYWVKLRQETPEGEETPAGGGEDQ